MKQSEGTLESRGSRTNRLVGITVFVIGWGLMAVLAFVWLAGGSNADARVHHDTAKNSISNIRLRVVTGTQAAAARDGAITVRISSRTRIDSTPSRLSMNVTVARTSSSRPVKAGSGATTWNGKPKTIRIRMSSAARKVMGDCADPLVKVTVKRGGKSKTYQQQLSPDRSLCAVPPGVNLSRGKACEFIDDPANPCLGTFPNDFYTRKDPTSDTGLRLNLSPDATPMNKNRVHIGVSSLNTSDGFSAGPGISIKIPGLDNQAAFTATGLVAEGDMTQAYALNQPALLIDASTGQRQLIWTELNSNAPTDAERTLIIRPGKNLTNGHRYIVALRNLKNADSQPIPAPAGFRLYRDGDLTSSKLVESRRAHFDDLFRTLGRAGVKRSSLYLAWDFTVASTANITGRMLSIRDRAFHDLGDDNLTDGTVQGDSPQFTVTDVQDFSGQAPPYSGQGVENIRTVSGTFQVPCYLNQPGCPPGSTFNLDADQKPVRSPGNMMTARFTCDIPRSAVVNNGGTWEVDHTVRPSLYGHGLFGDYTEVNSRDIRQLGTENGMMVCGTDWSGMAEDDVTTAAQALMDLTKFPAIPDRLQQGFLNFLFLGRLLIHPDGLASDPAFQFDGDSVIDRSDLFYYGNSQGGIAGGALTAVATDFTRSVLYVPAMNYSTLLPRSVDFDDFEVIMQPYYPSQLERPLIFALMQTMWDRGEPNGYANHMTSYPLPNTPAHKVLIEMAYGDHQVTNVATEVEARTIGAPLRTPTVSRGRSALGMINPWVDHEILGDLSGPAADGSGYFVWDIGPKRIVGGQLFGTDPAPLANTPPNTTRFSDPFASGYGIDPHDTVIRSSPLIRAQIANFLKTNGKITDPCGVNPCWAAGWNNMP